MILLDTVSFLWIVNGSNNLSKKAKSTYLNKNNKVYLSSISVWEIIVKYKLGKIPLSHPPNEYIPKQRFTHDIETLPLEESDVLELESLPKIHNDPFDRMLICQAKAKNLTILTPDKIIKKYPVKTVW